MMPAGQAAWTVAELLEATDGQLIRGKRSAPVSGISIDSRSLQPGEAFVAIRGPRFDGHQFVEGAAHRGGACLIVSQIPVSSNGASTLPAILVPDTTEALARLARFHRRRMGIPVIAITGSCGKTTTKDLIMHLLGGTATVLKTQGTQNNQFGVPLTLLRLNADHCTAVVELGTNHPGEIARLAAIAEPTLAVITNVGPAHLEFFGSVANVLREKLSLLEALPAEGSVVLPGDQLDVCLEATPRLKATVRVVTFGTTDRCDIQAVDIQRMGQGMSVRLRDCAGQWTVPLVGYHNVENTLAAIACAWAMGLPLSMTKERLASFEAVPMRSQVVRCDGVTLLNDCYNANPLSCARALETLGGLPVRRKVAILGDMLELGEHAPSAHQAIGRLASQLGIDLVMAVGAHAQWIAAGVREGRPNGVLTYDTVSELLKQLSDVVEPGDGILVKGSRKLRLEQVTEFLMQRYRGEHALTQ